MKFKTTAWGGTVSILFVSFTLLSCEGDTGPRGPVGPGGPIGPQGPQGPANIMVPSQYWSGWTYSSWIYHPEEIQNSDWQVCPWGPNPCIMYTLSSEWDNVDFYQDTPILQCMEMPLSSSTVYKLAGIFTCGFVEWNPHIAIWIEGRADIDPISRRILVTVMK